MAIRTPDWWYRRHAEGAPWWRFALWPFSLAWLAVNGFKAANARPYRSSLKVISVGNVTLGGSGKTPLTATLLAALPGAVGLSRGHGGSLDGPVQVDPAHHTAAEVGDEPLMLGQNHPFWIARDRAAGLRAIEATDARIVVVDDAHQNTKIAKDVHILIIDGDTADGAWPFGDGGICPYGPLREPLAQGLARADVVVVWLQDKAAVVAPELQALLAGKPVFVARLEAEAARSDAPVFGFAGIAKPWKFEATLRRLNYNLVGFAAFADHAVFSATDLDALARQAEAVGARLITTEKDWVRLTPEWRQRIDYAGIRSAPDDMAGFVEALTSRLG